MAAANDILRFWFGELRSQTDYPGEKAQLWFRGGEAFDRKIAECFGPTLEKAVAGMLDHWAASPHGRLALIIVLDQFSRNLWRGTPHAFSQDSKALALSLEAIEGSEDRVLYPVERVFLYMPLMHAEDHSVQERSVACFRRLAEDAPAAIKMAFDVNMDFAERHKRIVDRFGRYPHRNEILGRTSTPEELAFLREPGSSF